MRLFKATCFLALLAILLARGPDDVRAATNAVQAGIGGVNNDTLIGGDGTGAAQITINPIGLALVKQARDLTGTVLPDGSSVAPGQVIYFVLSVANPTNYTTADLQLTDQLNEAEFSYVPGSMETALVPHTANAATIWTGPWSSLTDALGVPDDSASAVDSGGPAGPDRITVGSVPGQANQPATIPGQTLRAIRFKVQVK